MNKIDTAPVLSGHLVQRRHPTHRARAGVQLSGASPACPRRSLSFHPQHPTHTHQLSHHTLICTSSQLHMHTPLLHSCTHHSLRHVSKHTDTSWAGHGERSLLPNSLPSILDPYSGWREPASSDCPPLTPPHMPTHAHVRMLTHTINK